MSKYISIFLLLLETDLNIAELHHQGNVLNCRKIKGQSEKVLLIVEK